MSACPSCRAPAAPDAAFCARCGNPLLSAAGDLPAIERLIDQRARAILQEEKDEAARQQRLAAQNAEHAAMRQSLQTQVTAARTALDESIREPSTALGSIQRSIRAVALVVFGIAVFPGSGLPIHIFLVPLSGTSPAAVVCPLVCDGCSASARTFSWNFEGSWESMNGRMGYAFICKNRQIDIDPLNESDIAGDTPMNVALQPYMLSSFLVWIVETIVCVPVLALLLGPYFGLRRRARALARRPQLQAAFDKAEADLRAFDGPDAGQDARPYR